MSATTAMVIHNAILMSMTLCAVYITESLWALLPLVFLTEVRKTPKTKPKEGAE